MSQLRLIFEVRSGGLSANTQSIHTQPETARQNLTTLSAEVAETLNYLPGFLRATPSLVTSASREILHSATQAQTYRQLARGAWHELPGFAMEIGLAVLGGRVGGFLGQGATVVLGKGPVGFLARSLVTAWGMRVTGEVVEKILGQRQSVEIFKSRDLLSMFGVAAGDVVGARVHHLLQSRVQSMLMSKAASYVYSRISGGLVMNYSAVLEISLGKLFNAATGTNFFSTMHEEHLADHLTLRSMAMGVVKDFAIHSGNRSYDRVASGVRSLWNNQRARVYAVAGEQQVSQVERRLSAALQSIRHYAEQPHALAYAGGTAALGVVLMAHPSLAGLALPLLGMSIVTKPSRYHLPDTPYFRDQGPQMTLEQLAGYAQSERRLSEIGANLHTTLRVPLNGPLEYSPFGAGIVERCRDNEGDLNFTTAKWERALVASPATAILGLGEGPIMRDHVLRAEAADVIMEGKAKFFLWTAGVRTDPLCLTVRFSPQERSALAALPEREMMERIRIMRAEKFAQALLTIGGNYGFINVEDAQGKDLPLIFEGLEALRGETAIWSDDRQGTGVITAAGVLSWAKLTNRDLRNVRGVIMGAGAGARGVYDELIHHGMAHENILVTDSRPEPLSEGRHDARNDIFKGEMCRGIKEGTTLKGFARGADFVINLGVVGNITKNPQATADLIKGLNTDPLVAVLTNPQPGIDNVELKGVRPDALYASGNQLYPNTFNNFAAFGYVGAGVLMARATGVSAAMTVAAARGISRVAEMGPDDLLRRSLPESRRAFGPEWLVPRHDDVRLIVEEAGALAKAAAVDGLSILLGANPEARALEDFNSRIDEAVTRRAQEVAAMRREVRDGEKRFYKLNFGNRYAPFAIKEGGDPYYHVSPELNLDAVRNMTARLSLPDRIFNDYKAGMNLVPAAMTEALTLLRSQTACHPEEIRILTLLTSISPDVAMALTLARIYQLNNNHQLLTVFHSEEARRLLLEHVPEAERELRLIFPDFFREVSQGEQ